MSERPDPEALRVELADAREALLEKLSKIEEQLEDLDGQRQPSAAAEKPSNYEVDEGSTRSGRRKPVRQVVLDVLEDCGTLLYSRELSNIARAIYGRQVPASRFGGLARDEANSFESSRPRPVYLCHGLTHDRGLAIKRLWGRSDWPLAERIVAPTTGRAQHLRVTAALCEIALDRVDTTAEPETLHILAADHASDLPGVKVKRGDFELKHWRDVARELLEDVGPEDEQKREDAAERLSRLSPRQQLFGAPEQMLVVVEENAEEGVR